MKSNDISPVLAQQDLLVPSSTKKPTHFHSQHSGDLLELLDVVVFVL